MCIPTSDFSSSLLPQGLLSLFYFSVFVSHCLHICKHYLHICNSIFVNHFYNETAASYCPQNIYLIKPLQVYKVLSALHSLPGMDTLLTDSAWASVFNDELMFCKSTFLDIWPLYQTVPACGCLPYSAQAATTCSGSHSLTSNLLCFTRRLQGSLIQKGRTKKERGQNREKKSKSTIHSPTRLFISANNGHPTDCSFVFVYTKGSQENFTDSL